MAVIFGTVAIIFLAYLGAHKSFTRLPILGNVNIFFLTGTEFLFVGLILGPDFANMLSEDVIIGVSPFIGLGLGWLGLLYGIQFDFKKLIRIPAGYLFGSVAQSLITFVIVFSTAFFVLKIFEFDGVNNIVFAVILASIGSCSSQSSLALLSHDEQYRRSKTVRMLRFMASVGDFPGLIIFGFLLCYLHSSSLIPGVNYVVLQWAALTISMGLLFGWLLILLLRMQLNKDERLLYVIGMVLFSGGIASYLRLSPLFVNFIAGLVIANFQRPHHLLDNIMSTAEKPVYLILLVLAGSLWSIQPFAALAFAVLFLVIRIAAKFLGSYVVTNAILKHEGFPSSSGFGLVNQGGMALAMVINLQIMFPDPSFKVLITVIITAIIMSELTGLKLARSALNKEASR